ncbi:hypothetical protein COLO4_23636 [Corchorus olitorius]|uniref:CCHC-type domain-containing protein n=1 Tax=Corchorus olitorius TaxID=93759 RepID=A0A1R3IFM0_9ROSI|nr:hypothetical protein COLO4_23636 [Corchorus olitorius]
MSIRSAPAPSSDISGEEADILQRSNKRIKESSDNMILENETVNDQVTSETISAPNDMATDNGNNGFSLSYKDKLVGSQDENIISFISTPSFLEDPFDSKSEGVEEEGVASIHLSKEEKQRIKAPWAHTDIVKTYVKNVGYNFPYPRVKAQWKPEGKMDYIDVGFDFFVFRFHLSSDYSRVIYGGPLFVGPHFLSIRQWTPGFKPGKTTFTTTAVWARLPRLSLELFDSMILKRIGNQIGRLLRFDANPASASRGKYARLCVEVDLDTPLLHSVKIGKDKQPILYETISDLCFSCGCIGHNKTNCPNANNQTVVPDPVNGSSQVTPSMENEKDEPIPVRPGRAAQPADHGEPTSDEPQVGVQNDPTYRPWMVVTKRKNMPPSSKPPQEASRAKPKATQNGSTVAPKPNSQNGKGKAIVSGPKQKDFTDTQRIKENDRSAKGSDKMIASSSSGLSMFLISPLSCEPATHQSPPSKFEPPSQTRSPSLYDTSFGPDGHPQQESLSQQAPSLIATGLEQASSGEDTTCAFNKSIGVSRNESKGKRGKAKSAGGRGVPRSSSGHPPRSRSPIDRGMGSGRSE